MKKKTDFATRLQEALDVTGIKPVELSEKTGLSQPLISQYLKGKFKAKQNNLYKIAVALNVNEGWLMGFDVEMERPTPIYIDQEDNYVLSDQEKILIDKFRKIEDNDRYIVIGFIDGLLTAETSKNKNAVQERDTLLSRTIKLIECNMKDFSPGELNQVIGYVLGIKEHHIITQCPRRKGTDKIIL